MSKPRTQPIGDLARQAVREFESDRHITEEARTTFGLDEGFQDPIAEAYPEEAMAFHCMLYGEKLNKRDAKALRNLCIFYLRKLYPWAIDVRADWIEDDLLSGAIVVRPGDHLFGDSEEIWRIQEEEVEQRDNRPSFYRFEDDWTPPRKSLLRRLWERYGQWRRRNWGRADSLYVRKLEEEKKRKD